MFRNASSTWEAFSYPGKWAITAPREVNCHIDPDQQAALCHSERRGDEDTGIVRNYCLILCGAIHTREQQMQDARPLEEISATAEPQQEPGLLLAMLPLLVLFGLLAFNVHVYGDD